MNWSSLWQATGETLLMTMISIFLAYLIGLPMGVLLYVTSKNGIRPNRWINTVVGVFVNIMRSIPCLILVVLCMPVVRAIFGRGSGKWYTMIIPLFVTAFGFIARLVEQSLQEVPSGELEAARSLGASDGQLIYKVLIPEARISLLSGLAVSSVSILGFTSFAYNIGAGGLISEIWRHYATHTGDYAKSWYFWILIIIVVSIVQVIQELTLLVARKMDKRRLLVK